MSEKSQQWELLTESEKQFLFPLQQKILEISAKYSYITEEGEISEAVNEKLNAEFKSFCEEKEIDIQRAVAISTKLFNSSWYSIYITDFKQINNNWVTVFSMITSKKPNTPIILEQEDYPDFYKTVWELKTNPDKQYQERLKNLHLTNDFKFIDATVYETLITIAEIYTGKSNGAVIPRTGGRKIKSYDMPIDKMNNGVWNMLSETATVSFDTTKKRSKKKVFVLFTINFDALQDIKITKNLNPFDKRVYLGIGALYNAGNTIMTIAQIYSAMGYKGTPGKTDRQKINDSITKMRQIPILIDNQSEVDAGYSYPLYQYDGSLLPTERIRAFINGELVEGVVHAFREPPMISFARGRKQITTFDKELLNTPINKTNSSLAIEDYLLIRIARARDENGKRRILYSSIYEKAHLDTPKQQQRSQVTIKKILDHYVSCGFIDKYTMDENGISFTFSKKKLPGKT